MVRMESVILVFVFKLVIRTPYMVTALLCFLSSIFEQLIFDKLCLF